MSVAVAMVEKPEFLYAVRGIKLGLTRSDLGILGQEIRAWTEQTRYNAPSITLAHLYHVWFCRLGSEPQLMVHLDTHCLDLLVRCCTQRLASNANLKAYLVRFQSLKDALEAEDRRLTAEIP